MEQQHAGMTTLHQQLLALALLRRTKSLWSSSLPPVILWSVFLRITILVTAALRISLPVSRNFLYRANSWALLSQRERERERGKHEQSSATYTHRLQFFIREKIYVTKEERIQLRNGHRIAAGERSSLNERRIPNDDAKSTVHATPKSLQQPFPWLSSRFHNITGAR
jgi:hypothetical protein